MATYNISSETDYVTAQLIDLNRDGNITLSALLPNTDPSAFTQEWVASDDLSNTAIVCNWDNIVNGGSGITTLYLTTDGPAEGAEIIVSKEGTIYSQWNILNDGSLQCIQTGLYAVLSDDKSKVVTHTTPKTKWKFSLVVGKPGRR